MLAEWDSAESKHLEIIYHNQEIEYEIKNLIKDTEYCFAIKVFDNERSEFGKVWRDRRRSD